jgi:hypothetical protein
MDLHKCNSFVQSMYPQMHCILFHIKIKVKVKPEIKVKIISQIKSQSQKQNKEPKVKVKVQNIKTKIKNTKLKQKSILKPQLLPSQTLHILASKYLYSILITPLELAS